ncbi:MAG: CvpA family protein [Pseudomonadota bacterium]
MTLFDAAIVALVAVSVALAAYRGGLAELGALLALAIGAGAGLVGAAPAAAAIGRGDSTITLIVAGAAIAGVVFLAALVGANVLIGRIQMDQRQRLADRVGGGVFGFVRAFALIGLAFLGYAYYQDAESRPAIVKNAALLPFAEAAAGVIEGFAPAREPLAGADAPVNLGPDAAIAPDSADRPDAVAAILADVEPQSDAEQSVDE